MCAVIEPEATLLTMFNGAMLAILVSLPLLDLLKRQYTDSMGHKTDNNVTFITVTVTIFLLFSFCITDVTGDRQ